MKNVSRSMISVIVVQLQAALFALVGIHIMGDLPVVQSVIPLLVMEKQHLILEIVRPKEYVVLLQFIWMEWKKHLLPVVKTIKYHLTTMMALS